MGGGGVMRAAAKLTGITVGTGGFRGISAEHLPVSSSARRAASVRPALTTASSTEEVKLAASRPERTCSEIDDWMFTGGEGEGEAMIGSGDLLPRVVFGQVPTLKESKEATSELTDALEKAYLSSECGSSLSNSPGELSKACVINGIALAPSFTSPAVKTFKLLRESTAAQNVVASIACDPNVWTAVLQNQELQEFLHSQKSVKDSAFSGSDNDDKNAESNPSNGFTDWVVKIKVTVVDMMNSMWDYLGSFFGGQGTKDFSDGTEGKTDFVMEKTFIGLAIMVIAVILVKRG